LKYVILSTSRSRWPATSHTQRLCSDMTPLQCRPEDTRRIFQPDDLQQPLPPIRHNATLKKIPADKDTFLPLTSCLLPRAAARLDFSVLLLFLLISTGNTLEAASVAPQKKYIASRSFCRAAPRASWPELGGPVSFPRRFNVRAGPLGGCRPMRWSNILSSLFEFVCAWLLRRRGCGKGMWSDNHGLL